MFTQWQSVDVTPQSVLPHTTLCRQEKRHKITYIFIISVAQPTLHPDVPILAFLKNILLSEDLDTEQEKENDYDKT